MPLLRNTFLTLALLVAAGACSGGGGVAAPAPAPSPAPAPPPVSGAVASRPHEAAPPLPAIPLVDGPLAIRVVYPSPNQTITSRDSNFIFGSVGSGRASLTINGVPVPVYPNGAFTAYLANPSATAPKYDIVASRGTDSVSHTLNIRYPVVAARPAVVPPATKPENLPTSRADTIAALNSRIDSLRTQLSRNDPIGIAQLGQPAAADSDITIYGKPIVAGTYKWFFTPGTLVPVVGRVPGAVRVRLDDQLDVFVDSADARDAPAGATLPRRTLSNMRVRATSTGADVIMPIGAKAPYFVEEGDRSISVTLYGVRGNTDIINYASDDSLVRTVEWSQLGSERTRVTVNLHNAPYGYLVLWENNSLVLKLRGRPAIVSARPLAGLTIAVDPGHPPIGATGPTGLYEGNATLMIGQRVQRMLEERGATVIMTRTTEAPVALGDRPIIARRANAHAFVSIHLNAYPDGVNPFVNNGTGTYFFRTHSEPLAREVQRTLVAQLGLRDLGVNYDNLAVVRSTWYPAVLCEGAFLMIPEQEAALRTPEFQDRYARGVVDGLENYFRNLANR
ncbi:MAG: N-acetylmuramoyl-L-alanine amidase [Gemmatimonadota bacterium]